MTDSSHIIDVSHGLEIAAIRFFNTLPLVYELDRQETVVIHYDVPARMAERLETGQADVALVPTIDLQRTRRNWLILPAGAIGSKADVLTVQLFSKLPFEKIRCVACDGDSHTAAALLQIIFQLRLGRNVDVTRLDSSPNDHESVLLIGDKVLVHLDRWPFQMDLGGAWSRLTGLPFAYAVWAAVDFTIAERATPLLQSALQQGYDHLDSIINRHAQSHGFEPELAKRYFTEHLCYEFGPGQIEGLHRFFEMAYTMKLIPTHRTMNIYQPKSNSVSCK